MVSTATTLACWLTRARGKQKAGHNVADEERRVAWSRLAILQWADPFLLLLPSARARAYMCANAISHHISNRERLARKHNKGVDKNRALRSIPSRTTVALVASLCTSASCVTSSSQEYKWDCLRHNTSFNHCRQSISDYHQRITNHDIYIFCTTLFTKSPFHHHHELH